MTHPYATLDAETRSALRVEAGTVARAVVDAAKSVDATAPGTLLGLLIAFIGSDEAARKMVGRPTCTLERAVREVAIALNALGPLTEEEVLTTHVYGVAGIPSDERADVIHGGANPPDGSFELIGLDDLPPNTTTEDTI